MSTATVPTTFLIISDTHDFTPTSAPIFPLHLPTPQADVLLRSGDLTSVGSIPSFRKALTMLASIPAELKLVIAGNHDLQLDQSFRTENLANHAPGNNSQDEERPEDLEYHAKAMGLMTGKLARQAGVTYLVEGTHEFTLASGATFKIYVSPYTPEFGDWAFAYAHSEDRFNTPEDMEKGSNCKRIATNPIPADVDIVMTHGPPQGILDLCMAGNVGCPHLLRAMKSVRPMVHCFGHVHEGSGIEVVDWKVKEKEAAYESCICCQPCASVSAINVSAMMSQMVAQPPCAPCTSLRSSSVRGQQLNLAQRLPKQTLRRVTSAAAKSDSTMGKEKVKVDDKKGKEEKGPFKAPALDPSTPSPIFGGSTGGLLRKAQVEEFYVITWDAKKEQIFEMPTGGAAIMRNGPNLLKLARKEQCLSLLSQLRNKFKTDGQVHRVFPNGEVQYLHPKDGVYPEKVNKGREAVGSVDRRIGANPNPINVKFTGYRGTYDV